VARVTTLLVLAAGRARRYGGIKPLAPIGPNESAVIDLLAGDAIRAGFDRFVLVVNRETGQLIRNHVTSAWPFDVAVEFAVQSRPLGTVDAVLAARDAADDGTPFAVANADDLYGTDALGVLASHLEASRGDCLVGYRLDRALVGDLPVTRGVCEVADGVLTSIVERRSVRQVDGEFQAEDGLEPSVLDPASLVSMNLWGFSPDLWDVFREAMLTASAVSEDNEVLLPELVGRLVRGEVADAAARSFTVLATSSRCLGVTHPDDLPLVRAELAAEIERGERPPTAFDDCPAPTGSSPGMTKPRVTGRPQPPSPSGLARWPLVSRVVSDNPSTAPPLPFGHVGGGPPPFAPLASRRRSLSVPTAASLPPPFRRSPTTLTSGAPCGSPSTLRRVVRTRRWEHCVGAPSGAQPEIGISEGFPRLAVGNPRRPCGFPPRATS
jgi:hypothetical protein